MKLFIYATIIASSFPAMSYASSFLGKSITFDGGAKLKVCAPNNGLCTWSEQINSHLRIYIAKNGQIFDYSNINSGLTARNGGTATYRGIKVKFRHSGRKLTIISSSKGNLETTSVITVGAIKNRCSRKYSAKFLHRRGKIRDVNFRTDRCTLTKGNIHKK